jgi:hypothetical protein
MSLPDSQFELSKPLILITEGKSDNLFFSKLLRAKELPEFDMPFGVDPYHSESGFIHCLRALNGMFTSDRTLRERIKGVLIVADAKDVPIAAFGSVRKQIRDAGKFGVPTTQYEVATSAHGWPAIAVMLLPGDRPGGFETLCYAALSSTNCANAECVAAFIECSTIVPDEWSREKLDKVRLQCLVGVTYKENPTAGATYLFSAHKGKPPPVDIGSDVFLPVADRIREFCVAVGVPA